MTSSSGSLTSKVGNFSIVKLATAIIVCAAIWLSTDGLPLTARWTLIVFWGAIAAWLLTRWDDAAIALTAAVALVATGAASQVDFRASLGSELIWLLIAAFMIAGAIRSTTLVERMAHLCLGKAATIEGKFHALTAFIVSTAIVIPSTSARAAMLLPVYLHLVNSAQDAGVKTSLSLLFPTVILLSACGFLTGAGAHLIALDLLQQSASSTKIGYLDWLILCLPIALITSHAATHIILKLFAPEASGRRLDVAVGNASATPNTSFETYILGVIAATLAFWVTTSIHGASLSLIGLAAALALSIRSLSGVDFKALVTAVDWRLILFLAATILLGQAMLTSGAGRWIADGMMARIPSAARQYPILAAAIVVIVALLSHLIIVSRSARAAVLIPAFSLPFAALGYSPEAIVMLTVVGTGFCQTFPISAKPVAIFSGLDEAAFSPQDLMRLSTALLPMMFVVLLAFATLIWPLLGFSLTP